MTLQETLSRGLQARDLKAYEPSLLQYIGLLKKWNKAYNLVAECDDQTLLSRHIFDSLSVREYVKPGRCLDVGTGAGLPGLVLAVTMPDTEWTLLDANGKKTRFCEQVVLELGLKQVTVVQQRIEEYQPARPYDTIISRAYDQADRFVDQVKPMLASGGRILAMKGKLNPEELASLEAFPYQFQSIVLRVPEMEAQRHLLLLEPS